MATAPIASGSTFGRYRIVDKLGQGGMGSVWRADDTVLGRPVALKFLAEQFHESDDARRRFLREARAASKLDHPGVGTVYDFGEQDGHLYLAMRLVEGGTIASRLAEREALGIREAVTFARDAALALGHAHARGVVHRDVSARNLMLTGDGRVVVVDFGLAMLEDATRVTRTGATIGTIAYMAPEIIQGGESDARSDVYALGVVLYEMLTGSLPFDGDGLEAVLASILEEVPQPPSERRAGVPVALDRVVMKALQKAPADRHSTMEAFAEELSALIEAGSLPEDREETATVPPRGAERKPRPRKGARRAKRPTGTSTRRRWMALGGLAAVLAAVAVGVGTRRGFSERSVAAEDHHRSVAVLPLRNDSADKRETAHIGEGLAQNLITKLTQIAELEVTPWMTSKRFRDLDADPVKLAATLGVDALLVGSYRSEGGRLRGTVALVEGRRGRQVWADRFDEAAGDLFRVQKRIALGAATRIVGVLSGEQVERLAVPAGRSAEAYELYLKGTIAMQEGGPEASDRALDLFRRATEIDPELAEAWAGLGGVLHLRYFNLSLDSIPAGPRGGPLIVEAQRALDNALALDPAYVPARRGLIRVLWARGEWEACLKQAKIIAETQGPTIEALLGRAEAYMFCGLPDKAIPLIREAIEQDPASQAGPYLLTVAAIWAGQAETALAASRDYFARFGDDVELHYWSGVAALRLGDATLAKMHLKKHIEMVSPGVHGNPVLAAAHLLWMGEIDYAEPIILERLDTLDATLERDPGDVGARLASALCHAALGDHDYLDDALAWFRDHGNPKVEGYMAQLFAVTSDTARAAELFREELRRGGLPAAFVLDHPIYPNPHVETWPGGAELLAEYHRQKKRLETLY